MWFVALIWFFFGQIGALVAQQYPSEQDLTSMNIEELALVKVFTASRHLEKSSDAPSAVSVITAEEIARHGWRTLGDVLSSVRGFYTAYDRDYTYLGVRGFLRAGDYNSRILLLINGHRLNDKLYDSAPVGTEFPLDLDLIDRIEIVRGPSSSLFGTNAFFGVINVITRRPTARVALDVSADTSSLLGRTGQVTANFEKNGFAGLISGSMYRSDGQSELFFPQFDSPLTNNGIAQNMDGDRYDHAFADLQWGGFRLQGLFSNRTKITPTAPFQTTFNDPRTRSKAERDYIDLSYHRSISSKTDLDLRGYYDSGSALGVGSYGGLDPATTILGYIRGRADWFGTEANLGRQFGRQRITAGAEYNYCIRVDQKNYSVIEPSILNDHRTPQQVGTYVQAELNPMPKLTVNAGLRFDWFDTFGGAYSPRVAVIYKLNPQTSLKYIFGRAFRAPAAYESYYVDTVTIGEASPHLQPEHIQSNEVVLERTLRPWLQATADAFYNDLQNLIDEAPDPANGLSHFVNDGRDHGRGLELELEAKRESGLATTASYTLTCAMDSIRNTRLENSPLNAVKLNATIPLGWKTYTGLEILYSSPQGSYQGTRIASQFLTNITLSSKPLRGGWQFSASCYNALNRRWFTGADPGSRSPEILQDGRTIRFKVSYHLPIREGQSKR